MPYCHISHTQIISVIFVLNNPENRSVTPLKLSSLHLSRLTGDIHAISDEKCLFVQLIAGLVT